MKLEDLREKREFLLLKQKLLIERLEEYIKCTSQTTESCLHQMKTFEVFDFNIKDLLIAKFTAFLEKNKVDACSLIGKLIEPTETRTEFAKKDEALEAVENLIRKSVIMKCFVQTQKKSDMKECSDMTVFIENNKVSGIDELEDKEQSDETTISANKCSIPKHRYFYIILYSGEILDDVPEIESSELPMINKLKFLQKENILHDKPCKKTSLLPKLNKEDPILENMFLRPLKYKVYENQLRKMILVEKTKLILDICIKIKDWEIQDLLRLTSLCYLIEKKYIDILSLEDNILIDYIVLYLEQKDPNNLKCSDFEDLFYAYDIPDLHFEIKSIFLNAFSQVSSERSPMILNYIFNISPGYSKIIDLKDYENSEYFYLLSWTEKYKN